MPLPKPKKYEREKKFINRCMINKETQKYPQKQRVAICLMTWRKKK